MSSRQLLVSTVLGGVIWLSCNSIRLSSDRRPWALLRVELDDQLLVDGHCEVGAGRERLHASRELLRRDLEPVRDAAALGELEGFLDARDLAAALAHRDHVGRLREER